MIDRIIRWLDIKYPKDEIRDSERQVMQIILLILGSIALFVFVMVFR